MRARGSAVASAWIWPCRQASPRSITAAAAAPTADDARFVPGIVDTRAMPSARRWCIVAALVAAGLAVTGGPAVRPGSAGADPVATTEPVATIEPVPTPDPVTTPDPLATPDPVATPEPPTPEPPPTPAPTPDPGPISGGSLAVGFTEPNANLLWPAAAKSPPAPFGRWRDQVARIRPSYYRLVLDWRSLQPDPDGPLVVDRERSGCLRARPPCAAYGGLREQLQALAARQAQGGWQTVVAIADTPDWAAEPPSGCERPGTE